MKKTKAFSAALIVAFLALAIPARGQEKEASQKPAAEEAVRKVILLRYARADNVASLLRSFNIAIIPDNAMKVVSVAGRASAVEAIEEAIKKLDVPPPPTKDIDLTAYFLLATRQAAEGAALPPELHDVVHQLRSVLNYQGFTLLNTALLRTRDGEEGWVSGVANGAGTQGEKANFELGFHRADVISEGKVATIKIIRLDFALVRGNTSAKIHTDIDLPEGAKVVVGKTSFDSPDNALVLVLTAKVVE